MKCFKKRKAKVTPQTAAAKIPQQQFKHIPVFFYIPGHNARAQGTYNYLGQGEYSFYLDNSPIFFTYLEYLCPIIPAYMATRPIKKSYSAQVDSICDQILAITNGAPSFGFNGHYNSARGAIGSENLVIKGSPDNFDDIFGDIYTDLLDKLCDIKQRHSYNGPEADGIKYITNHNGSGMLKGMARVGCTSTIGEPCFDYKYKESIAIFNTPENVERYFKIIAITVVLSYYKRGLISENDIQDKSILELLT